MVRSGRPVQYDRPCPYISKDQPVWQSGLGKQVQ